jgi:hypothetical protein
MTEQQLSAVKQALEALMVFRYAPPAQRPLVLKAIADLEQAIAQDALDKKAENARELGLSYDDVPAQKPWVGLDEDEVEDCARGCANHAELARAIEAKLKEKNT